MTQQKFRINLPKQLTIEITYELETKTISTFFRFIVDK